jgi:kynurenine formamidase
MFKNWPPRYEVDDDGKVVGFQPPPLNNWGRWGPDDRRGAANFITPEARVRAAGLIRRGQVFSLALPLDASAPVPTGRHAPLHLMVASGMDQLGRPGSTDDYLIMSLQGSTQWDGFGHWIREDVLYNGFWAGTVDDRGARTLGIEHLAACLTGRGVLLDVCRLKGVDRLPPGYAISPADLDAAAAAEGVEVRSGDLLFVRTGHLGRWWELSDKAPFYEAQAGLALECAAWLHAREIAAVAADNGALEVITPQPPGRWTVRLTSSDGRPQFVHSATSSGRLHTVLLRDLGITIGELFQLDALAADCARDGVYEFFVCAQPLPVTGGVGSPVNPTAIK